MREIDFEDGPRHELVNRRNDDDHPFVGEAVFREEREVAGDGDEEERHDDSHTDTEPPDNRILQNLA
jgi:hypothetical protein